jgi:hypothetical protein
VAPQLVLDPSAVHGLVPFGLVAAPRIETAADGEEIHGQPSGFADFAGGGLAGPR